MNAHCTPKALAKPASPRGPNHIDKHIGARMRMQRASTDTSQSQLAKRLGVTFQQVQKYERGANRVSGSRMWELAQAQGVPVGFYFEGLSKIDQARTTTMSDELMTFINSSDGMDALRAFMRCPDEFGQRRQFIKLINACADAGGAA